MTKRISNVVFSSNFDEVKSGGEKYFAGAIEELKTKGADDLAQVYASYKDKAIAKCIVGVRQGVLMISPDDRIALPCPPYCHPNVKGMEVGELSFEEALEKIKP